MVQLKQVSWYITATSVKYSGSRYLQYIVIYFRIKHKKNVSYYKKGLIMCKIQVLKFHTLFGNIQEIIVSSNIRPKFLYH